MIAYFDTSAVVPLFVEEEWSQACRVLWDSATFPVSSAVVHAETFAALARHVREGRFAASRVPEVAESTATMLARMDLVPVTRELSAFAGELALRFQLRGFDAIHVATSLLLPAEDTVFVSGDRRILAAWRALGLTTVDIHTATA